MFVADASIAGASIAGARRARNAFLADAKKPLGPCDPRGFPRAKFTDVL